MPVIIAASLSLTHKTVGRVNHWEGGSSMAGAKFRILYPEGVIRIGKKLFVRHTPCDVMISRTSQGGHRRLQRDLVLT